MKPVVEPPATMYSCEGELTTQEASLPPATVLGNHRKTIQTWLGSLSSEDLDGQMEIAQHHESFGDFIEEKFGDDHEFGEKPVDDLCQFEMWLKKRAYRDMLCAKHARAKALPTPSATAAPEAPKAEVPKSARAPKPASRESGKGKGTEKSDKFVPLELSDAEKEAYGSFWNKFDKKSNSPNTPATTASTSQKSLTSASNESDGSTGLTPECRRKLALESPAGQIAVIAIFFLPNHRENHLTGCKNSTYRANILQFQ